MPLRAFEQDGPPRVVFGQGTRHRVVPEVVALGAERVLVVTTHRNRAGGTVLARELGGRCVGHFDQAEPQVPVSVAQAATELARSNRADWLVAHGGGTAIGVAKAVALDLQLQIAAVPTTYAGSELTDIWGVTNAGVKTTGRSERVRPRLAVYDPELLIGLRPQIARNSLFNALAHAIETLWAPDADDALKDVAEQSVLSITAGLRKLHTAPTDLDAVSECLYGSHLASLALGRASMALHHKLAHVLGGSFDTPHAATHAILLPHTVAYNQGASAQVRARLQRVLGDEPAQVLWRLAKSVGIPTALTQVGFALTDVDRATALAVLKSYPNPREVTADGIRILLTDAVLGRSPSDLGDRRVQR